MKWVGVAGDVTVSVPGTEAILGIERVLLSLRVGGE